MMECRIPLNLLNRTPISMKLGSTVTPLGYTPLAAPLCPLP
jgi:hypothetical protein